MKEEIIIAGFGGQGIVFAGNVLATAAMEAQREVTLFKSYGVEMRGGTANCTVIISTEEIGSPIVSSPTTAIIMNAPSLEKFLSRVRSGGKVFIDSFRITQPVKREDVKVFSLPATKLADELGDKKIGNIILLGKFIQESNILPLSLCHKALEKILGEKKKELLAINQRALETGFYFECLEKPLFETPKVSIS
jgi:2-oxoglutarate ferredoxin oxidoreductase subunit gamma